MDDAACGTLLENDVKQTVYLASYTEHNSEGWWWCPCAFTNFSN